MQENTNAVLNQLEGRLSEIERDAGGIVADLLADLFANAEALLLSPQNYNAAEGEAHILPVVAPMLAALRKVEALGPSAGFDCLREVFAGENNVFRFSEPFGRLTDSARADLLRLLAVARFASEGLAKWGEARETVAERPNPGP